MRRLLAKAMVAFPLALGFATPGWSQAPPPPPPVTTTTATITTTRVLTPLAWYAAGGNVCAAVSPLVGTVLLGREMTGPEVGGSTLNCFLGPVGWVVGPMLIPDIPVAGAASASRRRAKRASCRRRCW